MRLAAVMMMGLVACGGGKNPPEDAGETMAAAEEPATAETAPGGEEHREPIEEGGEPTTPPMDEFGDGYWLSAEPAPAVEVFVFRAVARHGGGCAEHEFTIQSMGVGRSQPPTALLRLHHNGNGDRCRALLMTPVEIDLKPVLAEMGCVGRVSIAAPPATDPQAAGGVLMFDVEPTGCE